MEKNPSDDILDLCCGGKKCPVVRDEGDAFVIVDADQSPAPICLTPEQAASVAGWLTARLALRHDDE